MHVGDQIPVGGNPVAPLVRRLAGLGQTTLLTPKSAHKIARQKPDLVGRFAPHEGPGDWLVDVQRRGHAPIGGIEELARLRAAMPPVALSVGGATPATAVASDPGLAPANFHRHIRPVLDPEGPDRARRCRAT